MTSRTDLPKGNRTFRDEIALQESLELSDQKNKKNRGKALDKG